MNVSEPPAGAAGFDAENVTVSYDLSSGRIIAYIPPCKDDTGEDVAATIFDLSPAEAVELAGGITAAAVSAAQHLLTQRTSAPAPRTMCTAVHATGRYMCTLPEGHDADHIARDHDGHHVAGWKQR